MSKVSKVSKDLTPKRTTHSVQKEDKGSLKEDLKNQSPLRHQSRIIGLSRDGLIFLALAISLYGNYQLFKGLKNLNQKVSQLESQSKKEREIKITLDQKFSTQKDNSFSDKLEGHFKSFKRDIDQRFNKLERGYQKSANLNQTKSKDSNHLLQMQSINVSDYSIQNLQSYPKYHYYLSEQSRLYRELRSKLYDIITDFASGHRINDEDRPQYHALLDTRDTILNKAKDIQDKAGKSWKRVHRRYAQK